MLRRYQTIAELPAIIPVFPLAGALLLPRAELPLNIFEPRYLAMFNDAMSGQRVVGMVQPKADVTEENPELSRIGCLGRITSYSETDDGRLQVTLCGICRFELAHELKGETPYRRVEAVYHGFAADLVAEGKTTNVNRDGLVRAFRQYLEANSMTANWEEVEKVSTEHLVNSLSQLAPYPAADKQALLEAPDLSSRADMLIAMTELALSRSAGHGGTTLQ